MAVYELKVEGGSQRNETSVPDHVYYRWPRSIYRPLYRPLYRSTVDRLSADSRPTVDCLSADSRSTVG